MSLWETWLKSSNKCHFSPRYLFIQPLFPSSKFQIILRSANRSYLLLAIYHANFTTSPSLCYLVRTQNYTVSVFHNLNTLFVQINIFYKMTDSWEVFVLNEDPSDVTDQSSDKINSEETVKNIRVLITKLKGSHMSEGN